MAKLEWIDDDVLYPLVLNLLNVAKEAKKKSLKEVGKNVIDPFSAIFEMAGFDMTPEDWIVSEQARQAQKTLQNFIGEFHQLILGGCKGWQNMGRGHIIDLISIEKEIIAEVKNKFNTISGGKLADLYWSLESAVMNKTSIYKNYTSYHVIIIPEKPERFEKTFIPSDKEKGQKCPSNSLIRQIDGASFYELVTGYPNALESLYNVIPEIIAEQKNSDDLNREKLKELFKKAYG